MKITNPLAKSAHFREAMEAGTSYVCDCKTIVTIESDTYIWKKLTNAQEDGCEFLSMETSVSTHSELGRMWVQPYISGKRLPHSLDLGDGIWTGEETEVVLQSHPLNIKTKQKPCPYHF